MRRVVVALGGNAIIQAGQRGSAASARSATSCGAGRAVASPTSPRRSTAPSARRRIRHGRVGCGSSSPSSRRWCGAATSWHWARCGTRTPPSPGCWRGRATTWTRSDRRPAAAPRDGMRAWSWRGGRAEELCEKCAGPRRGRHPGPAGALVSPRPDGGP